LKFFAFSQSVFKKLKLTLSCIFKSFVYGSPSKNKLSKPVVAWAE